MSLRYSIYKVQTRCFALAHSFCILSHSVSFVKNFFQVFSNFSEAFLLVALVSNFAMLAHRFQFVKHFFQVSANFFPIRYFLWPPAGDLHILAHSFPIVKHYFYFFAIFFIYSFFSLLRRIPLPAGVGIR